MKRGRRSCKHIHIHRRLVHGWMPSLPHHACMQPRHYFDLKMAASDKVKCYVLLYACMHACNAFTRFWHMHFDVMRACVDFFDRRKLLRTDGRIDERKKEKRKLTRKKARIQRFSKQVSLVCVCVCAWYVCIDGMDEPLCL